MKTDQPRQLSVLLEHDSGVMEVFFAISKQGDRAAFRPVGSIPRSGKLKSTDPVVLAEAIRLVGWTASHHDVFEGRVVPDQISDE